jgi:hypothetical protein
MEGADMLSMRRVGLDVHGKETTAVVLDGISGELAVKRIVGRPDRVLEWLAGLKQPFQAVYEAPNPSTAKRLIRSPTPWLTTSGRCDFCGRAMDAEPWCSERAAQR